MSGKLFGRCYIDDTAAVVVEEAASPTSDQTMSQMLHMSDDGDDGGETSDECGDFSRDYIDGALCIRVDDEH
jgi:hypothetical protein